MTGRHLGACDECSCCCSACEWPDLPGYELEYDPEEEEEEDDDEEPSDTTCGTADNDEVDGVIDWLHRRDKRKGKLRFSEVDKRLQSGWLGVFFRGEGAPPLYALVSKPDAAEDERAHLPTLLLKGTARPLSREETAPPAPRYASARAAVAWVAFGGFERIYFRQLLSPLERPLGDVREFVDRVRSIQHTERERRRLEEAGSDEERAAVAATAVVAHMYHQLGVLMGTLPDEVEVGALEGHLLLGDSLEVKIPRIKAGPLNHDGGKLPLLAKWVTAVIPPPEGVVYQPYEEVARTIRTGDLLLFSSVKTTTSLIKLFDHAMFGHVGIAYRTEGIDEIYVWESKPYCKEAGVIFDGVQFGTLKQRLSNGWCNMAAVRNITGLTPPEREAMLHKMATFMKETTGRPYEKSRLKLALSSLDLLDEPFSLLKLNEEDLSSIFCSELVAAAYQRVGLLEEGAKCANRYTPEDFTTRRHFQTIRGTLEPEVYIDVRATAMMTGGPLSLN